MPKIPKISESEWEVMNAVWEQPGRSASEVCEALSEQNWKANTVRTFLDRLVRKNALKVERKEGIGRYFPAWSREECIRQESESFLQRVFQGATGSLLLHFAENSKLSPDDMKELGQILKTKKTEPKK